MTLVPGEYTVRPEHPLELLLDDANQASPRGTIAATRFRGNHGKTFLRVPLPNEERLTVGVHYEVTGELRYLPLGAVSARLLDPAIPLALRSAAERSSIRARPGLHPKPYPKRGTIDRVLCDLEVEVRDHYIGAHHAGAWTGIYAEHGPEAGVMGYADQYARRFDPVGLGAVHVLVARAFMENGFRVRRKP